MLPTTLANMLAERWRRIRYSLDVAGVGILVASDRLNFAYLTGHLSREFEKRFRHLVAVVDSDGGAHVLVPRSEVEPLRHAAPDLDVRVYDTEPLTPHGAVAFVREFVSRARSLVGVEMSGADRPCLTGEFMEVVARDLAPATLVDASPTMARARLLKDSAELGALRAAAEIAEGAWRDMLSGLRPGVRVDEVSALLAARFAARGADYNFPGHIEVRNATNASSPVIESGQILWCDIGVTVHGYHSDIGRRAVMGAPTDRQARNHADGIELLNILIEGLHPGRRMGDAVAKMMDARRGFHTGRSASGRFGHGLGLCAAEPPSLAVGEDAVIEAGMVLTPEPAFVAADGEFVQIEEMIAIGADGPLRLSLGAETLSKIGDYNV
jgi:Xaa-Pro aminopeptidase